MVRTITRSPMRAGLTPGPVAMILPQQSAPWMRGNVMGVPDQLASAASIASSP